MTISESIQKELDKARVDYEWIVHVPVYTMEEAAKVCGHSPEQGVKVLLVNAEQNKVLAPSLVVWTGNKKVDFDLLATEIKAEHISLATADEVKKLLGVEVGALTPFGYAKSVLYINPGLHDASVKLGSKDVLKLVKDWSSEFKLVDQETRT